MVNLPGNAIAPSPGRITLRMPFISNIEMARVIVIEVPSRACIGGMPSPTMDGDGTSLKYWGRDDMVSTSTLSNSFQRNGKTIKEDEAAAESIDENDEGAPVGEDEEATAASDGGSDAKNCGGGRTQPTRHTAEQFDEADGKTLRARVMGGQWTARSWIKLFLRR